MSLLKPEASIAVGLATATVVYGLFSVSSPSIADIRSLDAHNGDIDASERMAGWTAAGTVAAISLIAKDPTVFVIGGGMVIAMSWWHRHANAVLPATGRASNSGPASLADATPRVLQDEAPQLYSVPATGTYDSTF